MCCCGLNTILNLPANIADKSDGAPVDVSGLQGTITIELSGNFQGTYSILGSHDGNLYFPVTYFNSGASSQSVRQTLEVVAHYLKVHREAPQSSLVTVNIAGRATTACATSGQSGLNNFFTLATIPKGATGPQPVLDLFTLVASTGVDVSNVACGGSFHGQISVEGSLDGVNFSPLCSFAPSRAQRDVGTGQLTFDPVVIQEIIRYVRANILPGTVIVGPTSLTIAGPQNCDCAAPVVGDGMVAMLANQVLDDGSPVPFNYGNTYPTFNSFNGTAVLVSYWYDFSRVGTGNNVNLYMSVVASSDGNGDAVFGLFILPDGDPVVANLFVSILPNLSFTAATSTATLSSDGSITIPNPGVGMQILIAAQPVKFGAPDTVITWGTIFVEANPA
jgi:hypothetical protein